MGEKIRSCVGSFAELIMQCQIKRCRKESDLTYIGKEICNDCHGKHDREFLKNKDNYKKGGENETS